jgi:hypothetical protein
MPRALNEAVGFCPSSLIHSRRTPTDSANTGLSMSGVNPSPSETGASPASSGMKGAYRHWSHRGASAVPATTGA